MARNALPACGSRRKVASPAPRSRIPYLGFRVSGFRILGFGSQGLALKVLNAGSQVRIPHSGLLPRVQWKVRWVRWKRKLNLNWELGLHTGLLVAKDYYRVEGLDFGSRVLEFGFGVLGSGTSGLGFRVEVLYERTEWKRK